MVVATKHADGTVTDCHGQVVSCRNCEDEKAALFSFMGDFNFGEYAEMVTGAAIYRDEAAELAEYGTPAHNMLCLLYAVTGLNGEAGEVANKAKKILRDADGEITPEIREKLKGELGGVAWYLAAVAEELGIPLGEVFLFNYNQIKDRQERDVLKGSGDDR